MGCALSLTMWFWFVFASFWFDLFRINHAVLCFIVLCLVTVTRRSSRHEYILERPTLPGWCRYCILFCILFYILLNTIIHHFIGIRLVVSCPSFYINFLKTLYIYIYTFCELSLIIYYLHSRRILWDLPGHPRLLTQWYRRG